jgi:hypothetical protein
MGKVKEHGRVHKDGDWHCLIHVCVVQRDAQSDDNVSVLLQRRLVTLQLQGYTPPKFTGRQLCWALMLGMKYSTNNERIEGKNGRE